MSDDLTHQRRKRERKKPALDGADLRMRERQTGWTKGQNVHWSLAPDALFQITWEETHNATITRTPWGTLYESGGRSIRFPHRDVLLSRWRQSFPAAAA